MTPFTQLSLLYLLYWTYFVLELLNHEYNLTKEYLRKSILLEKTVVRKQY